MFYRLLERKKDKECKNRERQNTDTKQGSEHFSIIPYDFTFYLTRNLTLYPSPNDLTSHSFLRGEGKKRKNLFIGMIYLLLYGSDETNSFDF